MSEIWKLQMYQTALFLNWHLWYCTSNMKRKQFALVRITKKKIKEKWDIAQIFQINIPAKLLQVTSYKRLENWKTHNFLTTALLADKMYLHSVDIDQTFNSERKFNKWSLEPDHGQIF